jgi:hypothetical protein
MAKKKELTEEETIAELQKKIDAYNRRVAAGGQTGTMAPGKPGGGRRPKPGDTVMRPVPVKPKPGKPTRPGDSIMKPQPVKPGDSIKNPLPVKPGKGSDKVYRPKRDGGPKKLKGTR